MIQVSAVLITRNQAWNVGRLVKSVLSKASPFLSVEVTLVDSASTDATVSVACNYPINVIVLNAEQRLTAAAGRYVGYQNGSAGSRFVLFLDGDMELHDGWLEKALDVMIDDPAVAVVTGTVIDCPREAARGGFSFVPSHPAKLEDVKHCGGAALYRRSVLEEVGTFNPHLISDEEPELCIRIREAGYRVVQLDAPIALHYTDPADHLGTLFARARRGLYLGAGQNLRCHLGDEMFMPYLRERGFGLAPAGGLLAGAACVVLARRMRDWRWFGGWLALLAGVVGADALRKRSLYRAIYTMVLRLLIMDGTIRGFLMPPGSDSIKFNVVKRVDHPMREAL